MKKLSFVLFVILVLTLTLALSACGADGKDGVDGKDGIDGKDGVTPTIEISEDGYWIINGTKTEYKAIGTDGKDGADGEDGTPGKDGTNGTDGKDGKDGITPTIEISDDGYLVINDVKTEYKLSIEEIKCEHNYVDAYILISDCTERKILKMCEKCEELTLENEEPIDAHTDNNGKCEKCGELLYSSGLEYTLQSDNTYAVTGIGTCTDTDVIIPSTYEGLSVKSILEEAFYNSLTVISVSIPESITYIDDRAFIVCPDLRQFTVSENNTEYKSIDGNLYTKDGKKLISYAIGKKEASFVIPDGVTTIGKIAFAYCYNLASITIPESVVSIGERAFTFDERKVGLFEVINKSSLNISAGSTDHGYVAYAALDVHSGESRLEIMGDYAFYTHCDVNYLVRYIGEDTSITLPESYNGEDYEIGSGAFLLQLNLTSVVIPASVKSIASYVFSECDSLTDVYFAGTLEQWNNILFGDRWNSGVPATEVVCSNGTVSLTQE